MVGRAGRAGFGETGESILICKASEAQKVRCMEFLVCEHHCNVRDLRFSQHDVSVGLLGVDL
jgi:superfamily II DNA/RNA helicase